LKAFERVNNRFVGHAEATEVSFVALNETSNCCYSVDGSCGDTAGSYAGNSNIESGIIIGAGHKYLE